MRGDEAWRAIFCFKMSNHQLEPHSPKAFSAHNCVGGEEAASLTRIQKDISSSTAAAEETLSLLQEQDEIIERARRSRKSIEASTGHGENQMSSIESSLWWQSFLPRMPGFGRLWGGSKNNIATHSNGDNVSSRREDGDVSHKDPEAVAGESSRQRNIRAKMQNNVDQGMASATMSPLLTPVEQAAQTAPTAAAAASARGRGGAGVEQVGKEEGEGEGQARRLSRKIYQKNKKQNKSDLRMTNITDDLRHIRHLAGAISSQLDQSSAELVTLAAETDHARSRVSDVTKRVNSSM